MDAESLNKISFKALIHWMFVMAIIYCFIVGFYRAVEEDIQQISIIEQEQQPDETVDKNALADDILEFTDYNQYPSLKIEVKEEIFHPLIIEACNKHGMDPALVKAIILAESSYNPLAVSKKGARGLMQLMPDTASDVGVEDPFDPEHNINGGILYLKKLMKQFKGDLHLTLAAYNAGSKKVKKYQGIPPYNATRHYVENVLKYYQKYQKEHSQEKSGKA
ncbi:MAG: lytic transglycosylase domain-containing protein [Deltaproteobacteria bacterium]|nr:lytic transglycosylase domain-containing protein [Deltaproteobacteria bacterium]